MSITRDRETTLFEYEMGRKRYLGNLQGNGIPWNNQQQQRHFIFYAYNVCIQKDIRVRNKTNIGVSSILIGNYTYKPESSFHIDILV